MRIIAVLVLVFGVALSGGALFFASEYFDEVRASMAQRGPETVRVLVAKRELDYGTRIQPTDLQWVEWPKSAVPPGSFTEAQALLGEKGNEKRLVLRAIEPGEPILESKITKMGESPRMSMNLGQGRRAVSLSVGGVQGVSGFVAPGDRVDIMLIRTVEGELVSSIIMQNVEVIAVDQRANTESTSPRQFGTVTVDVSTREAQKLALAQQVGRLSLTLRGMGETDTGEVDPVTAAEINDFLKPEDPSLKVRVRRAGSLRSVEVDDGTAKQDAAGGEPGGQGGAAQAN